jgi:hypothetical protein
LQIRENHLGRICGIKIEKLAERVPAGASTITMYKECGSIFAMPAGIPANVSYRSNSGATANILFKR